MNENEELLSKHLHIPYVKIAAEGSCFNDNVFVCATGVVFTETEVKENIDIQQEHEKRRNGSILFDYNTAKNKGILVPKVKYSIKEHVKTKEQVKEKPKEQVKEHPHLIIYLLAFTSFVSTITSTQHTAEYLIAYTHTISAWLLAIAISVYITSALEVSILFIKQKRYILSYTFLLLWLVVLLFSMLTTVSVFYNKFSETVVTNQVQTIDVRKEQEKLNILLKQEAILREQIKFKQQDIEYRQKNDYATTAVRQELNALNDKLQQNLSDQATVNVSIASDTNPQKITLFAFLSGLLNVPTGVFEFIMSVLAAIFVNLIAPLSLTAAMEIKGGG